MATFCCLKNAWNAVGKVAMEVFNQMFTITTVLLLLLLFYRFVSESFLRGSSRHLQLWLSGAAQLLS